MRLGNSRQDEAAPQVDAGALDDPRLNR